MKIKFLFLFSCSKNSLNFKVFWSWIFFYSNSGGKTFWEIYIFGFQALVYLWNSETYHFLQISWLFAKILHIEGETNFLLKIFYLKRLSFSILSHIQSFISDQNNQTSKALLQTHLGKGIARVMVVVMKIKLRLFDMSD